MKKIFNYIFGLAIATLITTGFTACDTDLDADPDTIAGYNTVSVTFMWNDYRPTLDGQEITSSGLILPKSIETGELEIFRVSDGVSVFKEEVSTAAPIKIIHPVNEDLAVYEEGKYLEFTPYGLWDASASYQFRFKEWNITTGALNYIPVSELPGEVTIVDTENGDEVLFSQELVQNSPSQLNVMQLSATEFLAVPEDNEEDPETGYFKVRFLYTQDAFPDYPELKLVLYYASTDWTQYSDAVHTITLKANQLSDYIIMDRNYFGTGDVSGLYDLVDPNNESNYIVNNMTDLSTHNISNITEYSRML